MIENGTVLFPLTLQSAQVGQKLPHLYSQYVIDSMVFRFDNKASLRLLLCILRAVFIGYKKTIGFYS